MSGPASHRSPGAVAIGPLDELRFCLSGGVLRRSLVVALLVGTVLNLIAQGDFLVAGEPLNYWKIGLTYLVPFLVATYGAIMANRRWRRSLHEADALRAEAAEAAEAQAARPR